MNDAKKKSKTTTKKKATAKAKSGQPNKKPAKAKSTGTAKVDTGKSTPAKAKASTKVFRVDVNKGPVRQVSRADAIKDALRTETFTETALNAMLDQGQVIPSPDYYYATTEKALSKWAVEDEPESKPLVVGDYAWSDDRKVTGEVRDKDGTPRIYFTDADTGTEKSVAVTAKWGRASKEQIEAYKASKALVKDETQEVEAIPALTEEEKAELAERENVIITNVKATENASMVIGQNLKEISTRQLWRETVDPDTGQPYKRFGDYAVAKFGFTREYAQNLAQLSGLHAVIVDVAPARLKEAEFSIGAMNALGRSLNKQTKDLGLDDVEGFEDLRPLIQGTLRIVADVAPKNKQTGQPEITPRLVNSVTTVLNEIVKTGTVEIDGKQISISDAASKGILGAATQGQVLEVVAEGIKANRQVIVDDAKAAYQRSITPGRPAGTGQGPTVWFSGTVPELAVSCDRHGSKENAITSIGNGTFQTKCNCRWRIDAESGKLVCFEVNGKRVKPAE